MPELSRSFEHPRVNVVVEDAFKYLANKADEFDVIICDSTDPDSKGGKLLSLISWNLLVRLSISGTSFFSVHFREYSFQGIFFFLLSSSQRNFSLVSSFKLIFSFVSSSQECPFYVFILGNLLFASSFLGIFFSFLHTRKFSFLSLHFRDPSLLSDFLMIPILFYLLILINVLLSIFINTACFTLSHSFKY